jgi:hypothetical protein
MMPPSSGSKNEPSKKTSACYLLRAGFFLDLFFDPEGGGDIFLENVGLFSMDYRALYLHD